MTNAIEQIAARLESLHPRLIDLSLDRLRGLLLRLGSPERKLPPVIHIAGTNGKGSTCAFVRAMAEAAGLRVHVYTSPHLVRFNERIRIAGSLVEDDRLIATMEHIERINDSAPITVFEVITAAAFALFAETPADLCVLESRPWRPWRRHQRGWRTRCLRYHLNIAGSPGTAGAVGGDYRRRKGWNHEAGCSGGDW